MSNTHEQRAGAFIARLQGFVERRDRAALAALGRGLDVDAAATPAMHRYLVPLLPEGMSQRDEDLFYLVAALYARWHQMASESVKATGSFGRSLRALSDQRTGESTEVNPGIEHEFVAMLSTIDRENLQVRLRSFVARLGREGIGIDWGRLLVDLQSWDRSDRRVQRRWARDFWGVRKTTEQL